MNKSLKAKILALSLIGIISFNSYIFNDTKTMPIKATQTIEELEALKEENNEKIKQLQAEITQAKEQYDTIVSDEKLKVEYQNSLNEKIELQNQNIDYVMTQINKIDNEIAENNEKIEELKQQIADKNRDIDENIELFKQRIRAAYVSGNDTISAVLTGSTDFYDMLAKMELVSRVAKHDDEIINELNTQLEELKNLTDSLNAKQKELDENMVEANQRKQEFSEVLDQLTIDFQETQHQLDLLNEEKQDVSVSIEEKQQIISEQEEEHDRILADIAAAQEAARKEAEKKAEEKRKADEEARKAEEARIAADNAAKQNSGSSQTPSAPSTPAPTPTPAPQPPVAVPPTQGLAWPVPGFYYLSSTYGYRSFDSSFHRGIDIAGGGIAGAAIVAADDGVVVSVSNSCTHNYSKNYSCGCGGGYGNYLTIVHNDGTYSTLYGHCQSIIVSSGQAVTKGQTVGYVGTTGYSTGYHLHYEVLKNGKNVDPSSYY